jgi:hypothetical protein
MQMWPRIEKQNLPMKKKENENKSEITENCTIGEKSEKRIENRRRVRKQFHCSKLDPRWIKEE